MVDEGSATVHYIDVNTEEAEAALNQLEKHAEITGKSVMKTVNRSYQSMILLADIMGIAIPEWFNIMASAAIMAGEMFSTLAAAETVSVTLAWKAGITFSIATMMFFRAMQIQQQKSTVESSLHSTLMLLQLHTGRG